MAAKHPGHGRRLVSLTIKILLLAVALLAAAFATFLYDNWGSIRFTPFEQDAGDLLDQLIADSKLPVTERSAVEQLADEAELSTARQTLVIPVTANTVRVGFLQGCRRAGLGPPDAMTLGWEPDALCEGAWRGGTATVSIKLQCTRSCRADVTVYRSWF